MKRINNFVWIATAIICCTDSSFAQFNAAIYSFTPLTYDCHGGPPLGPGCLGEIYWDQNNNGPDGADHPPVVGNGYGECNFNTFPINGAEMLGIPGTFFMDPLFTISTVTPQPSRYYVVVQYGPSIWTSSVFTIFNGLNDYDISNGWDCSGEFLCNEPNHVAIEVRPGEQLTYACIDVCAGDPVQIDVGPLSFNCRPHLFISAGCQSQTGCDVLCQPALFSFDDSHFTYNPTTSTWYNWIMPGSHGCLCVTVENCLPVENITFEAVARDRKVELLWTTASESGMASFEVMRRVHGHEYQKVTSVAATNSTTESSYSYVDENVENGTVYEYTLHMISVNGDVSELASIATAVPSADHAIITEYALKQNFPNPFNPNTSIVFDLPEQNTVNLRVFNSIGQEVATLVNGNLSSGRHTVDFDSKNLASGIYFYTMTAGSGFTATQKMLLLK